MMESREMSRLYLQSARNVVGVVADHAVKSLNLSIASTLSSFEYALQLARAKSGREVMELSAAHYLNQLNVMRCSHDCHLDFICKTATDVARPFRPHIVVSTCVIL
jgi:hypothetical protein